jgi:protein-S-isoprenylcysteine O-methyltransferase Ste14
MPLHSYIVLAIFTLFGIAMIILVFFLISKGMKFMGKPSIDPFFFYSSKISLFASWTLFLIKAMTPGLGFNRLPGMFNWISLALLAIGSLVVVTGIINLHLSLKVGLPDHETSLKTNGLYRFSRNPIYSGLFLVTLASCLYFPEPGNIGLAVYAIFFHHRIILSEEKFLAERFGEQWVSYTKNTRRYI